MAYRFSAPAVAARRKWLTRLLIPLLLVGLFVGTTIALKMHRKLHVVNMLNRPATITIPELDKTFQVGKHQTEEVSIGEGDYTATIAVEGRPEETVAFTIGTGLWNMWSKSERDIINVAGAAVLLWEETLYKEHPEETSDRDPETSYKLYTGSTLVHIKDADYAFKEFPQTISIDGSYEVKSRISECRQSIEDLPYILADEGFSPEARLSFMETHLLDGHDTESLLDTYMETAEEAEAIPRCVQFLRGGLERKPVAIEWHRAYQDHMQDAGELPALRQEYDAFLQKSPEDSSLLYLRGRIGETSQTSLAYLDKALSLNPKHPYALHAKAYELMRLERFADAMAACKEAIGYDNGNYHYQQTMDRLRLATGQRSEFEEILRSRVKQDGDRIGDLSYLIALAAERDDTAGVAELMKSLKKAYSHVVPDSVDELLASRRLSVAYQRSDLAAIRSELETMKDPEQRRWTEQTLALLAGTPEKGASQMSASELGPGLCLQTAMVWGLKGEREKAWAWLNAFLQLWPHLVPSEGRQLADLLIDERVPREAAQILQNTGADPDLKAELYAALATLAEPADRAPFVEGAKRCNSLPFYPANLIRDAMARVGR